MTTRRLLSAQTVGVRRDGLVGGNLPSPVRPREYALSLISGNESRFCLQSRARSDYRRSPFLRRSAQRSPLACRYFLPLPTDGHVLSAELSVGSLFDHCL